MKYSLKMMMFIAFGIFLSTHLVAQETPAQPAVEQPVVEQPVVEKPVAPVEQPAVEKTEVTAQVAPKPEDTPKAEEAKPVVAEPVVTEPAVTEPVVPPVAEEKKSESAEQVSQQETSTKDIKAPEQPVVSTKAHEEEQTVTAKQDISVDTQKPAVTPSATVKDNNQVNLDDDEAMPSDEELDKFFEQLLKDFQDTEGKDATTSTTDTKPVAETAPVVQDGAAAVASSPVADAQPAADEADVETEK